MNLLSTVHNRLVVLVFGSFLCLSPGLFAQGINNPLDPSQLSAAAQPSARNYGEIMGINLKSHQVFPGNVNLDEVAHFLRYFHLMDAAEGRDYGPNGTPSEVTPQPCSQPIAQDFSLGDCDICDWSTQMGNMRSVYCKTKFANDVEIHAALATFAAGPGFPHFMFDEDQWGGSLQDAFINAWIYGHAFAENYCPITSDNSPTTCLVDLLELGNEPWGVPGIDYYQAIYRGYVLGINDYYNNSPNPPDHINYTTDFQLSPDMINQSNWRIRLSAPAYQFIQDGTLISDLSNSNYPTNDQVSVMPLDVWPYLESVNLHPYGFNFTRNEAGEIIDFGGALDQHPESINGMFLSLINAIRWRNDNQNHAQLAATEFGWDSHTVGAEAQASYIIRSLLMAGRFGVDEMVLYEMEDEKDPDITEILRTYDTSGLLTVYGEKKAAFYAVKRFRELLGDLHFLDKLNAEDIESESNNAMFYVLGGDDNKPTHLVAWLPRSMNGETNPLEEVVQLEDFPAHLSLDESASVIMLNTFSGLGHNTKSFNEVFPAFAGGSDIDIKLSPIPYLIQLESSDYTYPEPNGNPEVTYTGPLCDLRPNTETAMIPIDGGTAEVIILGTEHPLSVSSSSSHFSVSVEGKVVTISADQNLSSNEYYATITVDNDFCNSTEIKVFQPSLWKLPCDIDILELKESNTNVTAGACRSNPKTYSLTLAADKALGNGADILLQDLPASGYLGAISSSGIVSQVNNKGNTSLKWSLPFLGKDQTYQLQASFCNVPINQGPIKVTTDPDGPDPCDDPCSLAADISNLVIPDIGGTGIINISGNNDILYAYGKNPHFRVNVIGNQIQVVAPMNDHNGGSPEISPIAIYSEGCPSITVYVTQGAFTQWNCDISFTHFQETEEMVSTSCPAEFARTYELKFVSDRDIPSETNIYILNVPGSEPFEDQHSATHGSLGTRQQAIVNGSTQYRYVWKLPNINKGVEYFAKLHFCWVTPDSDPGRALAALDPDAASTCDRESEAYTNSINIGGRRELEPSPISLYPNPGNGNGFILDIVSKRNQSGKLQVFDLQGRSVLGKSLHLKEGKHSYKITTPDLGPGIYMVNFQTSTDNFSRLWQVR